jgi:hypothetical protein
VLCHRRIIVLAIITTALVVRAVSLLVCGLAIKTVALAIKKIFIIIIIITLGITTVIRTIAVLSIQCAIRAALAERKSLSCPADWSPKMSGRWHRKHTPQS